MQVCNIIGLVLKIKSVENYQNIFLMGISENPMKSGRICDSATVFVGVLLEI